MLDLYRDRARPAFTARETEQVRRIGPAVAAALRSFAARTTVTPSTSEGPGTALYDASGTLLSLDDRAARAVRSSSAARSGRRCRCR